MIEDTSKRDPMLHLIGSGMFDGTDRSSDYITGMESAGQQQLVNSQQVPIKGSEDLVAIGFKLGDQTDDLFRTAELPAGWKKRASDHAMWSYIDDHLGRERVAIFYKAAFYDRKAFCRINTVRSYVYAVAGGTPLLLDDEWATADAVRAAVEEAVLVEDRQAAEWDTRINGGSSDKDYIEWRDEHIQRAKTLRSILDQIGA